jgi:hypothetical protein
MSLTQRLAIEVVEQREASQQAEEALAISTLLYRDGTRQLSQCFDRPGSGLGRRTHRCSVARSSGSGLDISSPCPGRRLVRPRSAVAEQNYPFSTLSSKRDFCTGTTVIADGPTRAARRIPSLEVEKS